MRRLLIRALALLAVGVLPIASRAQDRLADARRLRDASVARYATLKDSLARAAAAEVVTGDTLSSPAFRVFVPAANASLGQEIVAASGSALRGGWLRVPTFDTTFLRLRVEVIPGRFNGRFGSSTSRFSLSRRNDGDAAGGRLNGAHDDDSAAVRTVGHTLAAQSYEQRMRLVHGDVLSWAGGLPPFDTVSALEWQLVSRGLRFSPSLPAQQCLRGGVRACRVVLGVDSLADPAHDAFDADGRRVLVYYLLQRQRFSSAEARDTAAMRRQCVDGRDDAACERFVRLHLVSELGNFGGQRPRGSFLRFVAVRSARSADSALMLPAGRGLGIGPRLAAVGGAPLDRLVGEWQQRVAGHSESPTRVTAGSTWAAMLITLLFGTMGVLGSRWR